MPKIGRNDPCPCGSGKKSKRCCLVPDNDTARAGQAHRSLPHHPHICADCNGKLNAATRAVMKLIDAGRLDQAERAAQDLRDRFPDVHDGYDCLGMVCQARGDTHQAVEYYRKVITFAHEQPDLYAPEFAEYYQALIDRLEPPAAA